LGDELAMEDEVNSRKWKWMMLVLALASIMMLGACKKKAPPAPPPPPPPPPAAPTASITASPTTINKGQSTTLTWQTSNATDVTIEGIGAVQPSGTQSVQPPESTTYRLVAKGAGGTQDATARVTVTEPPPAAPAPGPSLTDQQAFQQQVKDIYFDYDKYDLRPTDQAVIQQDVQFLQSHPNVRITVEGHCDERGSTEYNLALGDNRANAAVAALTQAGIAADRIKKISYGKEKPFCTESTEECWQQNRRAHFVFGQQ
jgi:peptidoglycan-associated lipoprotein